MPADTVEIEIKNSQHIGSALGVKSYDTYHHNRTVEALKAENERLRGALEKIITEYDSNNGIFDKTINMGREALADKGE
jgi:hypothetical protein